MATDGSDEPMHPACFLIMFVLTLIHIKWMADTGRSYDMWGNVYVNGEFSMFETIMYGDFD